MFLSRRLVRENDPSLVRPQTDLFLPDFSIQDLGLLVELLYRGEVALRTLRQAAPLRHLLRLLEIDLNLEASMATIFFVSCFCVFFQFWFCIANFDVCHRKDVWSSINLLYELFFTVFMEKLK
jgi:hypothetical protein